MKLLIKQLFFLGYLAIAISLPFSHAANSVSILFTSFVALFAIIYQKINPFQKFHFIPFALFVLLVIGVFYSEQKTEAFQIVETHLALLALPIALFFSNILSKNQQKIIRLAFVGSVAAIGIFCTAYALYFYFETGSQYLGDKSGHFSYSRFMHHNLTKPLDLHAIYFSLHVSLAALLVLKLILFEKIRNSSKLYLLLLFSFFCLLIYLLKSAVFGFAFPIMIFVFILQKSKLMKSNLSKKLMIAATFLILLFGSLYLIQSKLDRFNLNYSYADPTIKPMAIRLAIWESSWEAIQGNLLFGQGTGDAKPAIQSVYERLNFTIGKQHQFNAHNMFLEYWISNGLIAVILFIALIAFFIVAALKNKHLLLLTTCLLFLCFSFTESTMLRQKGIVFFLFFSCLFYYPSILNKTPGKTIDQ